jgi:hypothetical protein
MAGQYTAFLVAWLLFLAQAMVAGLPQLRAYRLNIQWMTSGLGMPYFDPRTALIVGPLPWLRVSMMLVAAAMLCASAACVTERQDLGPRSRLTMSRPFRRARAFSLDAPGALAQLYPTQI